MVKHINTKFFDTWTEESAYVLGLIFSDGTLTRDKNRLVVRISSSDKEILEKVKGAMQSEHAITEYEGHYSFGFGNKELIERLQEFGLTQRKSKEGTLPKQIPADFIPHFVRGYFDGDGHFTYEKHHGEKRRMVSGFTFGTEELGLEMVDMLCKLGLSLGNVRHRPKQDNNFGESFDLRYYTRDTKKLAELMYGNATIFMERKKRYYDTKNGTV